MEIIKCDICGKIILNKQINFEQSKLIAEPCYCGLYDYIKKLKNKIKDLKNAEDILLQVIYNDSWDLFGEGVQEDFTKEQFKYLKRKLPKEYFEKNE